MKNTKKAKRRRTLSRRPTRPDRLTNRECTSLLGAAIEGFLVLWTADVVREVLRFIATNEPGWKMRTAVWKMKADKDTVMKMPVADQARSDLIAWSEEKGFSSEEMELHAQLFLLVNPYIGGICNLSTIKNVRTAVEWWANRDDAWELFEQRQEQR